MSTTLPAPPEPELPEVLQDIAARFLPCLPPKELEGVRIFFQLRQMYWFYQDFLAQSRRLPKLKFAVFCQRCVEHVDALAEIFRHQDFDQLLYSYSQYLQNVPSCGCILVNPARTKVLLIRGFTFKRSWSFPKGKVNEKESELECAIREVREEVGLDLTPRLLAAAGAQGSSSPGSAADSPFPVIRSERYGKRMSLYVVPDVPEDTPFQTRTIGEVSDIRWFSIHELPKNFEVEQQQETAGGKAGGTRFWAVGDFMPGFRLWLAGKLGAADKLACAVAKRSPGPAPAPSSLVNANASAATHESTAAAVSGARGGRTVPQLPKMPAKRPQQQRLHSQHEQANHAVLCQHTCLELAGINDEYAVDLKPGLAFGGLSQLYQRQLPGGYGKKQQSLGLGVEELAQALGFVDHEDSTYTRLFQEAHVSQQHQQQLPPPPQILHPTASAADKSIFAGFEARQPASTGTSGGGYERDGRGQKSLRGSAASIGPKVDDDEEGDNPVEDSFEFPDDGAYASQKPRPADSSRHSQAAWDSRNQSTFGEGLAASSFPPQQMLSQHDRSLSRLINVPSSVSSSPGVSASNHKGKSQQHRPLNQPAGKRRSGKPRDLDTFGAAGVLQEVMPEPSSARQRSRGSKPRLVPQPPQLNPVAPARSGGKKDSETFGHML